MDGWITQLLSSVFSLYPIPVLSALIRKWISLHLVPTAHSWPKESSSYLQFRLESSTDGTRAPQTYTHTPK